MSDKEYELGNGNYLLVHPLGDVTIYNEGNIIALSAHHAYALWDALKDTQSDMSLPGSTPSGEVNAGNRFVPSYPAEAILAKKDYPRMKKQTTSELIDEYEAERAPLISVAWFAIKVSAVLVGLVWAVIALALHTLRS